MRIDSEYGGLDMSARSARTRGSATHLRGALQALAQGQAVLLSHLEQPWASVTFSGSRHTVSLQFSGLEAVEAGETFLTLLPEHEFAVPGQLVADASIASVAHSLIPDARLEMVVELLLLEEA
jgi:hypothetical protein